MRGGRGGGGGGAGEGLATVTHSDKKKKVTKCQLGHSECSIPTENAIKELQFDPSFKTVRKAKVELRPL